MVLLSLPTAGKPTLSSRLGNKNKQIQGVGVEKNRYVSEIAGLGPANYNLEGLQHMKVERVGLWLALQSKETNLVVTPAAKFMLHRAKRYVNP